MAKVKEIKKNDSVTVLKSDLIAVRDKMGEIEACIMFIRGAIVESLPEERQASGAGYILDGVIDKIQKINEAVEKIYGREA